MTRSSLSRQRVNDELLWIPVSAGELVDKLSILELKADRLGAADARSHAVNERDLLADVYQRAGLVLEPGVAALVEELKRVNAVLWEIEDELRDLERAGEFGERFVAAARGVYLNNDRRAAIKRAINELVGSPLCEQKSHTR